MAGEPGTAAAAAGAATASDAFAAGAAAELGTSLANQPFKLAMSSAGVLMLNVCYCLCLVSTVRAFSSQGTVATIALVYLTTSAIAAAAPTPGGLGAIEAAIAAGLTASGIDAASAVSATLMYRLWTFWIPTIPGWIAFNRLQRSNDL